MSRNFFVATVMAAGVSIAALGAAVPSFAQMGAMGAMPAPVTVGGAPMFADKNIVQNAVNSADHTTLVAAVTAAGLVETLQTPGPFTVFAPVNAAFAALPAGTVDTLLMPANKDQLVGVLTYHVIAQRLSAADLMAAITAGGGKAEYDTVAGGKLTFMAADGGIAIMDAAGNTAHVTIADVNQSNGVIHVVDKVLLPG